MSTLGGSEAVAITEAGRRGISRLVADAEAGHSTVLNRRGKPVAAVVSIRDLQRLAGLERDLVDMALVLARAASDSGNRTSMDEVVNLFGYTRELLDSMDDSA